MDIHPPSSSPAGTPSAPGPRSSRLTQGLTAKLARAVQVALRWQQGIEAGGQPVAKPYLGELIDTKHRYGKEIYPFWQTWQQAGTHDNFNTWLQKIEDGEKVPGTELLTEKLQQSPQAQLKSISAMRYLETDAERAPYRLTMDEEGNFCTGALGKLHTDDPELSPHIFVMGMDKELYVGVYEKGVFGHPSFFGGRPVLGYGRMEFSEGVLVTLSDFSGHYQPNKLSFSVLDKLKGWLGDRGLHRLRVKHTRTNTIQDGKTAHERLRPKT